jgi:cysteine desulfurase/selenocysteine lyase
MKLFGTKTVPDASAFPLLIAQKLSYLDNAATTQKPRVVLDAMSAYYTSANANVHRGVYKLADDSTQAYEDARHTVAKWCGVRDEEVIFTSGATHALNLAAHILEAHLKPGDEIITTVAEHHALFVPFQQLAKRTGATFTVISLDEHKSMSAAHINKHVTAKTKIIAVSAMSNVLGYSLDVGKIQKKKALLVVDAAQSIRHTTKYPAADFVAFSAHKLYGPMGVGILIGTRKLLAHGEPLVTGGAMIQRVTLDESTWTSAPARYEAGTPNVAGAVGLAAAIAFYEPFRSAAEKREQELTAKAAHIIRSHATLLGPAARHAPVLSFTMERVHAHDVAQILDSVGVCVRAGHHCCQPLHDALSVEASIRVSLAFYNTDEDLAKLDEGLRKVREVFP